jgi:enterochelin esterase-like enzyme
LVDAFLAELPAGPLVEWPDGVVFLYRGNGEDVGIGGDMIGARREDPMWRVSGTDLFWYETRLEPDARVSYHFVRDFDDRFPDPRNPWRVPGPGLAWMVGPTPQEQSSLALPGWPAPDHLEEAEPSRRGRIENHVVESRSRPGKIALKLYVPAGYDQGQERLPLAFVMDGDATLQQGLVARSLDNLIPHRVAPVLVAFLGRPEWTSRPATDDEGEAALAELLAKDVVGFLDARYRTDPAPERRAVIGAGFGAHAAAAVVFRRPQAFGALGLQSVYMLDSTLVGASYDLLKKLTPTAAEAPLRVYLDWGRYDRRGAREPWDLGTANAQLAAFLRERGYEPAGGQAPDASGWAAWRNRTDRVFGTLFPSAWERAAAVGAPLAR